MVDRHQQFPQCVGRHAEATHGSGTAGLPQSLPFLGFRYRLGTKQEGPGFSPEFLNQNVEQALANRAGLEDKEEVLNQFYSRSQHLIEKMTKMAMNLVPSSYKANICNAYEHFEAPIAQITGPGYIHISFHTQSDDKYCASPYGYVFKNNIKFGRILKDGSIKSGKSGRFGNLVYD